MYENSLDYAYEDPDADQPERIRAPRVITQPRRTAPRTQVPPSKSKLSCPTEQVWKSPWHSLSNWREAFLNDCL